MASDFGLIFATDPAGAGDGMNTGATTSTSSTSGLQTGTVETGAATQLSTLL